MSLKVHCYTCTASYLAQLDCDHGAHFKCPFVILLGGGGTGGGARWVSFCAPCRRHDGRGRGLHAVLLYCTQWRPSHFSCRHILKKRYVAADVLSMNAVMHQLRHQMQALKTIRAEARRWDPACIPLDYHNNAWAWLYWGKCSAVWRGWWGPELFNFDTFHPLGNLSKKVWKIPLDFRSKSLRIYNISFLTKGLNKLSPAAICHWWISRVLLYTLQNNHISSLLKVKINVKIEEL